MTEFAKADFCVRCGGLFKTPKGKELMGVQTKEGVVHWALRTCVLRERMKEAGILVPMGKEEEMGSV